MISLMNPIRDFWTTQREELKFYGEQLSVVEKELPRDLRHDICLFAADGIDRVGKFLDVRDIQGTWSIAQITASNEADMMICINHCGWSSRWVTWLSLEKDKERIAPLFQETTPKISPSPSSRVDTRFEEGKISDQVSQQYPSAANKNQVLAILKRYPLLQSHVAVNAIMYRALGGAPECLPGPLVELLRENGLHFN
eukprot:TRINITY_DN8544_c0_g2_i1.p1 TRINITY_DN8544_c0_g2~~TRINITY_DN8544_c0_g2_i1.p1  ORF type:complete len:197 (-),score=37.64 TRINITY_DN8544_c0_g2_i1:395-985(-)